MSEKNTPVTNYVFRHFQEHYNHKYNPIETSKNITYILPNYLSISNHFIENKNKDKDKDKSKLTIKNN